MILKNEIRMRFIIPVGKINKLEAKKSLAELISNYNKVIFFDNYNRQDKIKKILKLI